jgi:Fe-S oxidoreductase
LLETQIFSDTNIPFNFCKLIAGSEGTLAFITEIKLNLVPVPPKVKGVICVHLQSIEESISANLLVLKYKPGAVELMDQVILNLTKGNLTQQRNRFFVQGDPGAILIVEFARETKEEILEIYEKLVSDLKAAGYGYHYPILFNEDIAKVWALRKSGLGILSNMPGDAKPVSVIEDTAVKPKFLADYISDFKQILKQYNLSCVYHAHIGSGELHLRPILNLKDPKDVELFHTIAYEMARLVKRYRGSLSGEHGDGRLRGEFIPLMIGEHNYRLLKEVKNAWDPNHIFNTRKITDVPPMNAQLRYEPGKATREIKTYFDFSATQGIMRAAENCNGSGDCRKSHLMGGTMCPSYMATRDEITTTRARANILREFLTQSTKKNPFNHKEIYDVMDLCLSCKACKSECPSNVDMAKLKAEFLQHYYDANGVPFRTMAIAYINKINGWMSIMPGLYNAFVSNKISASLIKKTIGFASKRSIPKLGNKTLTHWAKQNLQKLNAALPNQNRKIWLFADEFTNYNDVEIGITSIKLLHKLGYYIAIPKHIESGRTFLSKGLLRKAKSIANKNTSLLSSIVTPEMPLIGIEPSCILTFRDEYPDLVDTSIKDQAKRLAKNALLIDDFLSMEIEKGFIKAEAFSNQSLEIKLHGHCQQKALLSTASTKNMLSLPVNYKVTEIKSGCCGMAGSFGYEKEHYDLSMKIGELILFPEVRKAQDNTLIAAPGTSCRHHIKDGTGRTALHPVEILWKALL